MQHRRITKVFNVKKDVALLLAVFILFFLFGTAAHGAGQAYTGTTAAATPVLKSSLLFSKKFGSNYKTAPTPIVAVDDTILFVSGVKLYKLNAKTGEEIASVKMQGSTLYATVAHTDKVTDGEISFTSMDTVYDENWNAVTMECAVTDYVLVWGYDGRTVELTPDADGVCKIPILQAARTQFRLKSTMPKQDFPPSSDSLPISRLKSASLTASRLSSE